MFRRVLYLGISGSHAYGTALPESDKDYRGVFVPSREELLGLDCPEHYCLAKPDLTLWSLHKMVKAALSNGPVALEMLYLPEDCVLYLDPLFEPILSVRDRFLSRLMYKTYTGFARGELKRLQAKYEKSGELDRKGAAHVIRLLETAAESLREGVLRVRRPNARDLLRIRNEGISMEELQDRVAVLLSDVEQALETSPLPERPDRDAIATALVDVAERALSWQGSQEAMDLCAQILQEKGKED